MPIKHISNQTANRLKGLLVGILLIWANGLSAQYFKVSGLIVDSFYNPISNVAIFIKNGPLAGVSDKDGRFEFELRIGERQLVFNHPDYENLELPLFDKNDTLNIILTRKIKSVGAAIIEVKWKDPALGYIKKAIEKRDYWGARQPSYSAEVYIKAKETYEKNIKARRKKDTARTESGMSLAEIALTKHYGGGNKYKEERNGVSLRGDVNSLFYLTTTDGEFFFYTPLVKIPALSEHPVMSPLSAAAPFSYKFSYLGSYHDSLGRKILRISMRPRGTTNSLFTGEIELYDSFFAIKKIKVDFPKSQLNEYDLFTIEEEFFLGVDSHWTVASLSFEYFAKAGSGKFNGNTQVVFKNNRLNPLFPKGFFGLEVSATTQEAYERDSAFWAKERAIQLEEQEIKFIQRTDSVERVMNSEVYLDSVERETNKVTLKKLFLLGQEISMRKKGLNVSFQPLLFFYQPWMPGGGRFVFWSNISKEFESKRSVYIAPHFSYGINNKDLNGGLNFYTMYNPYTRATFGVNLGREFDLINPYDAYINLFKRSNFYKHDHITVFHRQELLNGLFLRLQADWSDRTSIADFKFDRVGDELFDSNVAIGFEPYKALYADITLSYTPFQRYIREPKQKVILGSRWPTFSINYRKGIPGVGGAIIDYDYLEYRIEQEIPLGLAGTSSIYATSGAFLNRKEVRLIDYKFQRMGDPVLLTDPMRTFQLLDSTFPTFKRYYSVHYQHRFNGSLINKIPLLKKLQLRELAGISALYAPEKNNMLFYEGYIGIERVFKIWRERIKIGGYYVVGNSNLYSKPRFDFKIGFDFFDRRNNSW